MAQIAKMETQVEIMSSADKFYDFFRSKLQLLPKVSPKEFKEGKVVQGDWNSVGSVRVWTHTASGDPETIKETTEAIDDESKTITFSLFDGNLITKYCTTFKPTVTVPPSGNGNLVKWTLEFEKQNESKNIDAYPLINA